MSVPQGRWVWGHASPGKLGARTSVSVLSLCDIQSYQFSLQLVKSLWSNWNQVARSNCLTGGVFSKLSTLKYDVGWLKGLIWPLFFFFWKVAFVCEHATPNIMHINPGHISLACLTSECYEKAPVFSSQLWMLEALRTSGERFVILWHLKLWQILGVECARVHWNSRDAIFLPQMPVRPWWYRPYPLTPALTIL